jgi:3-hydroxymyristoyl/3-hydroxydecanoyl-(acyl carrier protein) dehydratase
VWRNAKILTDRRSQQIEGKRLNDVIQAASQAVLLPEVLTETPLADGAVLALRIPETLAYFKGHFDEIAVVPGVVQIQWAVHYARQHMELNLAFSHMEAVKFKDLLLPGQLAELHLRYPGAGRKLEFCYRSERSEYSSGRIYFHGDPV